MIISALLTSVGINLGLCFLFFTLYSILRKQPGNVKVYAPRLIAEGITEQRSRFNLERLVPSTGWVRTAWETSEEELLSKLGLDAVVLMRVFIFSMKVFSFATAVGIGILVPVNYLGNQLDIDFSGLPQKSIDSFSISNVNDGSKRLWIHFCAAYVFTSVVCYFLYSEYSYASCKRIDFFHSTKPQPHHFAILVRGIPVPSTGSYSESVESFFTEYHPSTYLSHSLVHRTDRLQSLMNDAQKLYRKLAKIKAISNSQERYKRHGLFGLWGHKVDLVEHYGKKLEDLEVSLRREQTSLAEKEVPAAFVCFKSRYGAAIAVHIQQGANPTEWTTEQAPEPEDIHWPFFSASFMKRWICKLTVVAACIILSLLFLIPVVLVQGLTQLEQLERWFPFLKSILEIAVVSEVITGYLPSLILQTFLSFVPPIMILLSSLQGYISHSQIERSACAKMLWFTVWNIFFANVLSGSALTMVNIFLDPKKIPSILAALVPAQASFFIAYVVTSGWTSISSELFRSKPLICNYLRRICPCKDDDDFEVPSIAYYSEVPKIIFFGLVGIIYFFLAPLILPFLLMYYFLGYIIYRNQILNVYAPKYETGGKFWPIVHNCTIFSLVLMHVIAIGIFGLKKLPLASGLIVPLPILTLLFNEYCRKRFLPIFQSYPAQCLIKKDKHDQSDPAMGEFLDKLVTAYQDPASLPVQYTDNLERLNSPLLTAIDTR